MLEIRGAPFIRFALRMQSMFCMPSRKSPRKAFPLQKGRLISSGSGWPTPSAITEKGRIEMISKKKKRPTDGTANVFADLGIANPEQELVKARLTLLIHRIIIARGLNQTQAAEILGVKQPQVSLLMRNRHGTFSISRLIDFLTALGQDVRISVR